jgi:hypothetical protein
VEHGPAPDHGLARFDEQSHGHEADAVRLERHDLAVLLVRLALHAQHARQVGAVDVSVQEPDARPGLRQRDRQVRRHGALPHAALARAHRDHRTHALERLPVGGGIARLPHAADRVHADVGDARDLHHRAPAVILDLGLERARRRGQHQRERHGAALHGDVLDHPQGDEVAVEVGVVHGAQCGEHGFRRDHVCRGSFKGQEDSARGLRAAVRGDPPTIPGRD